MNATNARRPRYVPIVPDCDTPVTSQPVGQQDGVAQPVQRALEDELAVGEAVAGVLERAGDPQMARSADRR